MSDYVLERQPVEANDNSTSDGINVVELLKEDQNRRMSGGSDDLPCLSVDWTPDFKYETESGKKWLEEAGEQDKKDLETTNNNSYVVERGDSFWGIAKRSLRDQKGEDPNNKEIQAFMAKIIEANKEEFPELDCNPHLIQPGLTLIIPADRDSSAFEPQKGRIYEAIVPPSEEDNSSVEINDMSNIQMVFEKDADDSYDCTELQTMFNKMIENLNKPVTKFDNSLDPIFGCARAVSEIIHAADPRIEITNSTRNLENALANNGYEAVSLDELAPGDVIIGSRESGMAGHTGIYLANGMIFNNNSQTELMQIDSIDKFLQPMTNKAGSTDNNGYSKVTAYRRSEPCQEAMQLTLPTPYYSVK